MTDKQTTTEQPVADVELPARPNQESSVDDAEQQELWDRNREQQARLSCPGCGGDAALF